MSHNLADERKAFALVKRLRKANKLAKAIAHGGFGKKAQKDYLEKYPEMKNK